MPASVGRLHMTGPRESGKTAPGGCHVVRIARRWAVTAAHCFEDFFPQTAKLDVLGLSIAASDVHFHPSTYGGDTTWSAPRKLPSTAYDIALVHLPAEPGFAIAKLWHPHDPLNALSAGQIITVTGSNKGFNSGAGEASGTTTFKTLLDFGKGWIVEADHAPSNLEPGDSGGGAFITAPGPSAPYVDPCAVPPSGAGELALIGINKSDAETSYFVPVFVPSIANWIVSLTHDDVDADRVCDAVDNCPSVPNPEQENCNDEAERAWGGKRLGDACDPTPCPAPALVETSYVPATSSFPSTHGDALVTTKFGRSIRDELDVTPILGDGSHASSAATARFCICRDASGAPLPDLEACASAPFFCTLDPKHLTAVELGGGASPLLGQTYWHLIAIGGAVPLAYPGAAVARTWDYRADFASWVQAGWIEEPAPDPTYGDGTDLGGWIWMHDPTSQGAAAHGGLANPADAFAPIAPDPREARSRGRRLPQLAPRPWWTYCAPCGDVVRFPGEQLIDPVPFVTIDPNTLDALVWSARGASPSNGLLSEQLRRELASGAKLVGSGEPAAITRSPELPLAIELSPDATTVSAAVVRGHARFERMPIDARGPQARTGFAAAWSRAAGALFVIGGRDLTSGEPLGDAWTWRPEAGFSAVRFDPRSAPTRAETATFSPRDARVWIVDRTETGRRLLRIDPLAGTVDSNDALPLAGDLVAAWLITLVDGDVALVAASRGRFRVARLGVAAFTDGARIEVGAIVEREGEVLGAPAVARGAVHVPVAGRIGEDATIHAVAVTVP
ncbi:MAG: trypsin-like serine protease [Deltaproteobacteria bacterium]|nr:trypsin-like serine protease [Deltaproteobacteria bacterium]